MRLMFWKKAEPLKLIRPIDQAINKHKTLLAQWNTAERKEIVAALLQDVFQGHHVHKNPQKKGGGN